MGQLLAQRMNYEFIDADDYHPESNLRKMARGEALTDADRGPWLQRLGQCLHQVNHAEGIVLACSALKSSYRRVLFREAPDALLVFLQVPEMELRARLSQRKGHFAKVELLASQLATLEVPDEGMSLDGTKSPNILVELIEGRLTRPSAP